MAAISIVLVLLFDWNHSFCFFVCLNTELLKLCHLLLGVFVIVPSQIMLANLAGYALSFSCLSRDRLDCEQSLLFFFAFSHARVHSRRVLFDVRRTKKKERLLLV